MNGNIIIFSVFRSNAKREDNAIEHAKVVKSLRKIGIPHTVLQGRYKGKEELSILVPINHTKIVEDFCKIYNQECYLQSVNKKVTLVYKNRREEIGTMHQVTKDEAYKAEAYSFNPNTNSYYVVKSEEIKPIEVYKGQGYELLATQEVTSTGKQIITFTARRATGDVHLVVKQASNEVVAFEPKELFNIYKKNLFKKSA